MNIVILIGVINFASYTSWFYTLNEYSDIDKDTLCLRMDVSKTKKLEILKLVYCLVGAGREMS